MNKKGFTLIEMLAVVVILGMLLALAVPSITGYLSKGKEEYYNSLEESIKLAAKDYTTEYRQLLPKVIGNVTIIKLSELTDNDYISNIVDSNGNSCSIENTKVAVMKTTKNEYEYYTCLNCGEEYSCDLTKWNQTYSENNNVTIEIKNYKVEMTKENYEMDADGNYIVDQGEEFTLPNAKAYYNGELASDSVEPNPKSINTNKLGTTTVTYVYKGKKEEIKVKVVDRVSPSIPQVVLREDNSKGNIYNGGWYNNNIYQEFLSTDYAKQGVVGSGIKKYEISIDGINYTELTSNYNVTNDTFETGEYAYYVRSVDNSDNVSEVTTYSFKLDKIDPKAEVTVDKKVATITLTDNIGVVAYGINQSTTTIPNYENIPETTNTTLTWTAKKPGTFYVWVKDISNRTSYTKFEIPSNAFCDYKPGKSWAYTLNWGVQKFAVPCDGTYKLEVWGASGAYVANWVTGHHGGRGGYSYGNVDLLMSSNLYVVVGGGSDGYVGGRSYWGGYNGGGSAHSDDPRRAYGAGGGYNGSNTCGATGASQTRGGSGGGGTGSFGQGAGSFYYNSCGGGGGWYGGGASYNENGGGGGSGHINTNYLTSYGMSSGARAGNGYAKITLVSLPE